MVGLHLFGAFDLWHSVTAPKRMFIGPRWSRWPFLRYQKKIIAYYDHVLRGVDNGFDALPPVRYWLHGAERWESADDWPIPDARPWRLHLTGKEEAELTSEPDDGSGERRWAAIPPGMEYPGAFEDGHVVRYSTAPLPADTHVVGPAHLTLRMASTAMDTHLQVRLNDLAPDGTTSVVSVGWLLASHRAEDERRTTPTEVVHDHTRPVPLVPGEPFTLRMSLAPFAQLVRAGHRLMLEIGSDPRQLAPPSSEYVYFGMVGAPYAARNTVLPGSRLELSVRGEPPW